MSRKRFVDGLIGHNKGRISAIVFAVADRAGVTVVDVMSKCRLRPLVYARQEIYVLARKLGCTLAEIADFFSAHHTTVIHGIAAHTARTTPQGETA